jgi:hypothetical protein
MNDRLTKEQREALITGEDAGSLAPGEVADVALLAVLLSDPSTWAEPDAGLEDDVVHAVTSAAPIAAVSVATRTNRARRDATTRRRRVVVPALSAAAAIAIVFGAVVVARSDTRADFTAELRATAVAPGAGALVDITHNNAGFRFVLDAHGLPALPAGEYYQAWLKSPAGTLVPIGTFSASDGRVTLWSGVSPNQFPTMSVTIEAADNNQATSGRRVLVGDVQRH